MRRPAKTWLRPNRENPASEAEPTFTQDWTSYHLDVWRNTLGSLKNRQIEILEIGSWEGRSAIAFLDMLPHGRITCIDTFAGGGGTFDNNPRKTASLEARFDRNVRPYGNRVRKIKSRSVPALDGLGESGEQFDLIYVDGSHRRDDVLADSILAWRLLRRGGIMIWDDYRWRPGLPSEGRPQAAIDFMLAAFAGCFDVLHMEYQVIVLKTRDWPDLTSA